jgi:hypothetical protein
VAFSQRPRTEAERERRRVYASPEHRAEQARVKRLRDAGQAWCWRCGKHIPPGAEVHAGHDDNDRTRYRGPECPPCNRGAAASKGARVTNAKRRALRLGTTPYRW